MNRKVLNATAITQDNIKFRSKAEAKMYELLKDSGLWFEYEPKPIVLQESFYPTGWYEGTKYRKDKVRAITYTPDFIVKILDKKFIFIIEVKGFITDRYPLKRKMLIHHIESTHNYIFAEVHTKKDMEFIIAEIKKFSDEYTSSKN